MRVAVSPFLALNFDQTGLLWNTGGNPSISDDNAWNGNCLYLDGGSFLKSQSVNFPQGSDSCIVAAFFTPSSISANHTLLYATSPDNSYRFRLFIQNANKLKLVAVIGSNSGAIEVDNPFSVGERHHVACKFENHGTTFISLYVDGKMVTSSAVYITGHDSPNLNFYIGTTNSLTDFWHGSVDEFYIKVNQPSTVTVPTAPLAVDSDTLSLVHFN